jgi:hypothetical protein
MTSRASLASVRSRLRLAVLVLAVAASASSWPVVSGCTDGQGRTLPFARSAAAATLVLDVRIARPPPVARQEAGDPGRARRAVAQALPVEVRTLRLEIGARGAIDLVAPPPFDVPAAAGIVQEVSVSSIPPGLKKRVFFEGRDASGAVVASGELFLDFLPGAVTSNELDLTGLAAGSGGAPPAASAPALTITSISPGAGPRTGGTSITISGTNFLGTITVKIGTLDATGVTVNAERTQITCVTPPFLSGGARDVTVTSSELGSVTRTGGFVYTTCGSPVCFGTPVAITTNINGASFVAIGDVNKDGRPDIVAVNQVGNSLAVILNQGGGTFGTPTTFATGPSNPQAVVIADFTNDGNPDLAFTIDVPAKLGHLTGDGAGSFGSLNVTDTGGTAPRYLAAGDFNADGKQDVAVANFSDDKVSSLLGNGNGTFSPAGFSPVALPGGSNPNGIAVADLDGDSDLDIVTANQGATNDIARLLDAGAGAGSLFSVGFPSSDVRIANLNGDAFPDAAVTNPGNDTISILPGGSGATFGTATQFAARTFPRALAVADMDVDGRLDIVTANGVGGGDVGVLLGTGTGSFGTPIVVPIDPNLVHVAVGDLNADGLPDIVAARSALSSTVYVVLAN